MPKRVGSCRHRLAIEVASSWVDMVSRYARCLYDKEIKPVLNSEKKKMVEMLKVKDVCVID